MRLKFHPCVVSNQLQRDHQRLGGSGLEKFVADVADGELRVMKAYEPAADDGMTIGHVSASVGLPRIPGPVRRPTDEEMAAVLSLFPNMALKEEPGTDPLVRHLWTK